MYQDETLKCRDCGNEFVFTAGEQEFYASRGFENKPSRCKECRAAKKNAQKGAREMFDAVCVECGKECQVPFKPTEGKPVYCSECTITMILSLKRSRAPIHMFLTSFMLRYPLICSRPK